MPIHAATHPDHEEALKALANPIRRQILTWLKHPVENFPGQDHPYDLGVCAGSFEKRCNLSQSTVSAHLTALHDAGLITSRRLGQWNFYKRDEAAIAALLEWLETSL